MSYENPRIEMNMTILDIVVALSEGNPGAINVLMEIVLNNPRIDPDDTFGPLGPLFELDNLDCYGSRIWMLYKDVCKHNLVEMLAVLRAIQLGFVENTVVQHAIENYGEGLNPGILLKHVQMRLPNFGVENASVE